MTKLLNKIEVINKKYPKINYGGCGVFTWALYKVLVNNYCIKPRIVYLEGPKAGIEYDIKFSHIALKIGSHYLDNNGFHSWDDWEGRIHELPYDKLSEMIGIQDLWSNVFDHNTKEKLLEDIENIEKL